jgi:hypothetical protein
MEERGGIGNDLTPLWQCHGQNVNFVRLNEFYSFLNFVNPV